MRYKIIYISPIVFIELFKHGSDKVKVINGLPIDAMYVRSFTNDITGWGRIGLVVESAEFEELKDGELIPIHETLFEKVD